MIQVVDNFLPEYKFRELQSQLMGKQFPWYLCNDVVNIDLSGDPICDLKYNWQMIHLFYSNPLDISHAYPILNDLLAQINPSMLLKIKANLNPVTDKIIEHGFHVDAHPSGLAELLTTSVFYVNSNDGYTIFEDGTKVESVENRLVSFPCTTPHSGTTCTNEQKRVVINLNYIAKFPNA